MTRRSQFILALATLFLLVSGIGYLFHYLIFRDVHHIFLYLIGDLAFLPLEVLLVTVVLERILTRRDASEIELPLPSLSRFEDPSISRSVPFR